MKMSAYPLPVAGFPNFAATQLLMSAAGAMNLQSPPASVSSAKDMANISPTSIAGARIPGVPESLSIAAAGGQPGAAGYPQLPNISPTVMMDPRLLLPALGAGFDIKDNAETLMAWRQLAAAQAASAGALPYDAHAAAMAAASFTYSPYPTMDLNGARRKNATRETTSTLKAWLYEHRKNPYPTKGEKIMLAIITKMTLTQVSTWFANARRRLKKENKMTWSPRNRTDDGSSGDEEDKPDEDGGALADDDDISIDLSDFESENTSSPQKQSTASNPTRESPNSQGDRLPTPPTQSSVALAKDCNTETTAGSHKPRIWSIADVATSKPTAGPTQSTHGPGPMHMRSNAVRHRPYPVPNPTAFRPFFDTSYRQFAAHPALGAVAALTNPLLACRPPITSAALRVPHLPPTVTEPTATSTYPYMKSSSSSAVTPAENTISKVETISKSVPRPSPSHSSSSRSSSDH